MADLTGADGGLRELALFAGAGGGILGGHLLGWRTVCAVEYEPYAASVLIARQNDGILPPFPIWDDVRTFDGTPWRGIVDVVSGGFPCQDISSAGKGAGIDGERSGLWGEMARIIGEVRPRYAFIENSPMLTIRGLDRVLCDLAALGYDAEWCVLGAADVGAPHKRDRIWILAHTEGQRYGTRGESRNICEENGGPQHGLRPEPASTGAQAPEMAHAERPEWGTQLCACDGLAGVHGVPQREEGPSGLRARGQILALATSERCGETGIDRSSQPAQRITGCGTDVADTQLQGLERHAGYGTDRHEPGRINTNPDGSISAGGILYPSVEGFQDRPAGAIRESRQNQEPKRSDWWAVEPDVGGKADGVAGGLDLPAPHKPR